MNKLLFYWNIVTEYAKKKKNICIVTDSKTNNKLFDLETLCHFPWESI